jgi:uncharacterized protein
MNKFRNPPDEQLRMLLEQTKTIAVVGLSPRVFRPSHRIGRALQEFGYRIIPVNPLVDEVLGERAYGRVTDIQDQVDLVNVFRAPQHVSDLVDDCIAAQMRALWLQDGVVDDAAAERAVRAGMTVVMDRCIYRDYLRLRS